MIYLIYCIFITFSLNFFWAHINLMKIQFTFVRPRCVATPFAEQRRPCIGYLNTCVCVYIQYTYYTIAVYMSRYVIRLNRTLLTMWNESFIKEFSFCAGLSFEIYFFFYILFEFFFFVIFLWVCRVWDYNTAHRVLFMCLWEEFVEIGIV